MTIPGGSEREIPGEWILRIRTILCPECDGFARMCTPCEKEAAEIITILRPLIEAETREALAACMIRNGVATGHGDTSADLIMELDGHFERERALASALRAEGK